MKNKFPPPVRKKSASTSTAMLSAVVLLLSLVFSTGVMAINTKTATASGNWSNANTWSPVGVPSDTDNVVISPVSANVTITVDGDYTCRNLYIGDASNHDAKVKISAAGNSLNINGDLKINPNTINKNFDLDAGPGDMYVNGTFSTWGNQGTTSIKISTGSITFTPSVALTGNKQYFTFSGDGTATFLSDFSDAQNHVTFDVGCTINFYGNYTISGSAVTWGGKGTANFYGSSKTITATDNIIMNTVVIQSGASVTLSSSGSGTFEVAGNLTLSSSSFTANKSYQLDGTLTNNGGTYTAGVGTTLTMIGSANSITGSTSCTFATLQIGKSTTGGSDVSITLTKTATVANLVFTATDKMHTLKLNTSGVTLTVTGNLTMNQCTKDNKVNTMNVNTGTLTVNGNLVFVGTNNTDNRVCQINVTSGTFNLDGTLTWMSNSKVKTEVISVTTGTVNFNSSITMGGGSGTIKVTTSGTINFNGTSAPSLAFGGSGTAPNLTIPYGATATFAKGLTATTTALTFATGSTQIFKGTGTITPTAAITFGHFQINATYTVTLAGNISVVGFFTNNGTFTPSTNTVTFSGGGTQEVTDASGTATFYKLTLSVNGSILKMNNNLTVTNTLTMNGHKIDANGYTLTLGSGSGAALVYTLGKLYNGTFKRYWPTSAITSTSGNYYGYFPIGTSSKLRYIEINSTSSPTTAGYVSAICTNVAGSTNLSYTDNEGSTIQAIANQHSDISLTTVAGGTYNINVKFTDLGGGGSLSNFKLETRTGGTMGSTGTHATTGGPTSAPLGKRTGVSLANLANAWVLGTNDRNASPMYTYLYSRKSGNWNDAGGNGTWSYTPGGSGAACSCAPSAAAYVTIENGHTVTLTATDSIQYVDINGGGALTINSSKTLYVTGDLTMFTTGTFTNNGTLKVDNELLMSSATSPTVNGNVTVVGYFTLPTGTAYTQTSGVLTIDGDIELNGTLTAGASASLVVDGSNANITGTGTFLSASTGRFPITNAHTFDEDANITFGSAGVESEITIAANTTVTNCGIITIYGDLLPLNSSTSAWIQQGNAILSATDSIMPTGIFDPSTSPNTVYYNGSGAQSCVSSTTAYYNLSATNGGTKTMTGDMIITNALTLGGTTIFDEGSYVLSGNGSLNMSGTAELKLTRNVEDTYPELAGTYNCTGGTVTITQTADSCQVQEGTYYNLKLNGSTPYNLSSVTGITNNLDVINTSSINGNSVLTIGGTFTHSSTSTLSFLDDSITVGGFSLTAGAVNCVDNSIAVNGAGGWTLNSGATFTAGAGTVYFTGSSNQTLGGTTATQTFYGLCVNKSSNTVTVGGSTTALSIGGDVNLNAGVFAAGTATAINMTAGNWNNNGGSFTPGSGTVTFNSTANDQAIQGLSSSETFNNLTMNKSGYALVVGESITTLTLNGNMTLTAGTFNAGTATAINMTAGNWTNNGATFTPGSSTVTFNGTGAQAINGTASAQTFYRLTVNKSSNTLSVGGSTTSLTLSSDITLSAGTFDKGTASTIYAGGNWTNNGGTFTYGIGTVECNSGIDQAVNGTGTSQGFYNLRLNKAGGNLNISGSIATVTVNDSLIWTNNGKIVTGSAKVAIPATAVVSGASSTRYIYGNEQIYIPNAAAPSRTFHIGDATVYAPVLIDFTGTTTGSGSVTASTSAGDDAAISSSGINSAKSVNRTWTMSNSGVGGFTSYAGTFNFVAGDIDAGANTDSFVVRRLTSGTWYTTTISTRLGTSTKITNETTFDKTQVGEKGTLTVSAHPGNATQCEGSGTTFTSTSASVPTPTVKWQRDPNTGTFADINGTMDGSVYTNYTTTTLSVSNVTGLNNYKYRAVFTNINSTVNSNQATLTANPVPTITATTPGSHCSTGTVDLAATASAGTINWYAASSGGASLGTGSPFTTPSISSTTTYYVDATANSCTTASRTAVTATIYAIPTITGTTPGSRCSSGTVALGATASAGTINWYAASSGGASLGSGTSYTTPSISSNTTYYCDATANGCTTGSRTSVLATIHPNPTATVPYQSCPGTNGSTTIRVAGTGGTGPYSYKINGGTFGSVDTMHVANSSTNDYYVQDAFGCSSSATNYAAVAVTPAQIPASIGTTSCSCPSSAEGRDVYLTGPGGDLIAVINDKGHDLGTITATVYVHNGPVMINNRQGGISAALGRNYVLDFTGTNLTPAVEVQFPYTSSELAALATAAANTGDLSDDISSAADLGSTQYEGPNEDSVYDASSYTMLVFHRQLSNGNLLNGKYVKMGLSANGEHWFHGGGGGEALPIKLVSFDAVANQVMERVENKWTTSLEIDNDYFTVERSQDGINFNEVARVSGAGNHTGLLDYRFDDVKPFDGLSYYRLKQTDFDGNFSYSNMSAVTMNNQSFFRLYPTPTEDEVNLEIGKPGKDIELSIFDMSGQKVYEKTYTNDNSGKNHVITIKTRHMLATGVYMLNVRTNGTEFRKKLVLN